MLRVCQSGNIRVVGAERREQAENRWMWAEVWPPVNPGRWMDERGHPATPLCPLHFISLTFTCALTRATCIHQHMLTNTHIHATCRLSVALTFPGGICGQSRVSLEPVDLFKFSDRDISAILYSYSPNAKIVSPLSAGSSWQVYQGLHMKYKSLSNGLLSQNKTKINQVQLLL